MIPSYLLLGPLIAFTAVVAWVDFRTGLIPNRLNLVGLGCALITELASALVGPAEPFWRAPEASWIQIGVGPLLCGFVPFLLHARGAMGGGDVKTLAILGVWLGPLVGLQVQLVAFSVGAALGIVRLVARAGFRTSARYLVHVDLGWSRVSWGARPNLADDLTSLRFGPAIFVATTLVTLHQGALG